MTETEKSIQEVWALFKETERRFKETDRRFKETDERFKELRYLFTSQWGKLIEALVEPAVLKLFQERGIRVIDTAQRVKVRRNGKEMEVDILATNEDSVIPIEVKTTLKVEDVNEYLDRLSHFMEFFERYRGMKLYGAVAGVRIDERADRYAYRNGLFVLTLSGEGTVVILNDEKFTPKDFS